MIWYGFKGYRKGLIVEIAGIVALLVGTWIAINFSNKVAEIIGLSGKYVDIIAFVITFGAVIFLVFMFAKFIEKVVTFVIPEFLNNIGGLILGAFKIAIIASILLYFITSMDKFEIFLKKDIKSGSILYKPVSSIAPVLFPEFRKIEESVKKEEIKK
jgi:membrane protein required for colicin V production